MTDLKRCVLELDNDPRIRGIVFTGNTRAFASGGNLKWLVEQTFPSTFTNGVLNDLLQIHFVRKPTVAAVNGLAMGAGFEFALLCDLAVAGERTVFGMPQVSLGITGSMGGNSLLTYLVGKSVAMDWVLTARQVPSQEAYQRGIISKVCPEADVLEEAKKLCRQITKMNPLAVSLGKDAIKYALNSNLREGLIYEGQLKAAVEFSRK
eukprot:TRINITY_DN12929_c0_g1_i7.p1 TRINITY_DN12929_c0_g1~~TRINITY_DN12929_c0_g1_i7.p1  ORF type:complete len:207 (-),score=23.20 TRINITY_DN12929_c0_g1_i7:151-771(-)